jgi:hypothetical protein
MIFIPVAWFKWIFWPLWPFMLIYYLHQLARLPCTCATSSDPCPQHKLGVSWEPFDRVVARLFWTAISIAVLVGVVIGLTR